MSHAKNVDTYSRLVGFCTGYGGSYNPGQQNLKLNAMRALLEKAQSSLQDVTLKKHAYQSATNDREAAFGKIGMLANRVVFTLDAAGVMSQTVDDVRFYANLINGKRSKRRVPIPSGETEGQPLRARSFTQQSFVAIGDHFSKLTQLVAQIEGYKPNEADLKVTALQSTAATLTQANAAVHLAKISLSNALIHRNRMLYKGETALLDNSTKVKQYVRAVFGYRSDQAKQLGGLSFTKPKNV